MGIPDDLVAFLIDATLDPTREGPFEQKEELLPHIGPLDCRRNAMHHKWKRFIKRHRLTISEIFANPTCPLLL